MLSFDPLSLIAMGGLTALIMGVVLVFMRRSYPPTIRGLEHWATASLIWLVAATLFTGPGIFPAGFERWLGNAFLLFGFAVFYVGCRLFVGRAPKWHRPLWLLAAALPALAWFILVQPSFLMRVGIITISLGVIQIANVIVLCRSGQRDFPSRMLQLTLVVHLIVMFTRMWIVWRDPQVGDLLAKDSTQIAYLGANVLTVLMLTLSAVLMATDRVRRELEHTATHDGLTGALNRSAILAQCADEFDRCARYGQTFSLMMLDLDHFKSVNDRFGHQHGDKVLVHFAERVRLGLRRPDRLGRYGGEEFVLLLPNTNAEAAAVVAARIHATLATGSPLDCKVSIGVTTCLGKGDTLDHMLSRADAAMYRAKDQGRAQTCTA